MSQVRLTRTPEIDEVLAYFRGKYHLLSDADILKIALSEKYSREQSGGEGDPERKSLKAFLEEHYKNIPYVDEEGAERDILEAVHASRKGE
jgi:hypothetical protein